MFREAIEKELLYPEDLKSQLVEGGLIGVEGNEYRDCLERLKNLIGNGIRLPEEEINARLLKYDVAEESP